MTVLGLILQVAHWLAHAVIAPVSWSIETICSQLAIVDTAFHCIVLIQRAHGSMRGLASEGQLRAILASHVFQGNSSVLGQGFSAYEYECILALGEVSNDVAFDGEATR